jgi:hypothetical protein
LASALDVATVGRSHHGRVLSSRSKVSQRRSGDEARGKPRRGGPVVSGVAWRQAAILRFVADGSASRAVVA